MSSGPLTYSVRTEGLAEQMPGERDRVLARFLGWTGLRFGEAAALRPGDLDLLRRRIRVVRAVAEVNGEVLLGSPKTHQARTVAFPSFLVEEAAIYIGHLEDAPLLFPNQADGYLSVRNWKRRIFDPAARRAKLTPPPLRVHDLRHTAASLSIAAGASVKAVQSQLGHLSATTTLDRYAHLWPDELDSLGDALGRLRTARPADSVRIPEAEAAVIPLESRR
jgi:integrase